MSRIKDFLFDVAEMSSNGLTVQEIANATKMPVEYIAEIVDQIESEAFGYNDAYETDSP